MFGTIFFLVFVVLVWFGILASREDDLEPEAKPVKPKTESYEQRQLNKIYSRIAELYSQNRGFEAPEKGGYWYESESGEVKHVPNAEYKVWQNLQYYLDRVPQVG